MQSPLCFIGMSGIGKSHWSKLLAARGWVRHDCDGEVGARLGELVSPQPGEELVHAVGRWMGMPWTEGYAARERRYLELEGEVTAAALEASLSSARRHVIDTTGSVIYLAPALLDHLRAECRIAYLRTPEERYDAMLARYLAEPKPVVWGGAFQAAPTERPEDALPRCYRELLRARDRMYSTLAHVTLDGGALEREPPAIEGLLTRIGG